jgi:hypothetical protein
MVGIVVLVGGDGIITAGHTVSESTEQAWAEAEAWLCESGTGGRRLLRLRAPNNTDTFRLATPLADVLAAGWIEATTAPVEQGVLL